MMALNSLTHVTTPTSRRNHFQDDICEAPDEPEALMRPKTPAMTVPVVLAMEPVIP